MAAVGLVLGIYLAVQVEGLDHIYGLVPGAYGALSFVGSRSLSLLAISLVGGLFAAFGLVEDLAFGRAPYAWVRAGSPRAYTFLRIVGPAGGAAAGVVVAGLVAWGYAFLRYPSVSMILPNASDVDPSPRLFEVAPLLSDLAWLAFVAFVTAVLTVVAATTARFRRQLVTLLFAAAFVLVLNLVAQGPLAIFDPVAHLHPADHFTLSASLIYWLGLGGIALTWIMISVRSGAERADA